MILKENKKQRKKTVQSYTKAFHMLKGKESLADETILKNSLQKAELKDIQIEKQNVRFEFASVHDYIKHVKGVVTPLKTLLDKDYI